MDNRKKKIIPISARKPVKRKAKDKPKRPLSAYNFFFSDERAKIVAIVEEEVDAKDSDLSEEELSRLRKDTGKVSFEEMGKIIGQRWKDIDAERKEYFDKLAEESAAQYKVAMKKYNDKQEALREKQKQLTTEMQYAEEVQRRHQPPTMQFNPSYGPPDMHAQMNYRAQYSNPMEHNGPYYGYHQMQMMNSYNPYFMSYAPPQGTEGHSSHGNPYGDNAYHTPRIPHNSRYQPPPPHGYYRSDVPNDNGQSFSSQHEQLPQNPEHDSNVSNYPPQEQRAYNGNKQSNGW